MISLLTKKHESSIYNISLNNPPMSEKWDIFRGGLLIPVFFWAYPILRGD